MGHFQKSLTLSIDVMVYNKTNYEISYKIYEDEKTVVIILIGTRENFYESLKSYIN